MVREKKHWKIQFSWVKTYVGIRGNELTDTLTKDTATNIYIEESYKEAPKIVVVSELSEISVGKWQKERD